MFRVEPVDACNPIQYALFSDADVALIQQPAGRQRDTCGDLMQSFTYAADEWNLEVTHPQKKSPEPACWPDVAKVPRLVMAMEHAERKIDNIDRCNFSLGPF